MWADAEDDLPPIPWFRYFRYNVSNTEVLKSHEENITCVQFELKPDDWITQRLEPSTVAQAVTYAEIYLSQIVDDIFLRSVGKVRDRELTYRYQYLESTTDVAIDVRDNKVIVLHN